MILKCCENADTHKVPNKTGAPRHSFPEDALSYEPKAVKNRKPTTTPPKPIRQTPLLARKQNAFWPKIGGFKAIWPRFPLSCMDSWIPGQFGKGLVELAPRAYPAMPCGPAVSRSGDFFWIIVFSLLFISGLSLECSFLSLVFFRKALIP